MVANKVSVIGQPRAGLSRVAVCGAGVMGAQIAAQCINAGLSVVLFDLAAKEGGKNAAVQRALAALAKLRPAPLATPEEAALIQAANYDDDLALLDECDLIIEAIAERLDWKLSLYQTIAPFIRDDALLVTNTSGLALNALHDGLPTPLKQRFCGVHFFNPPRYMPLVELIPTVDTQPSLLDKLENFLVHRLGKNVLRAKDTPNFIANRIGVFGMLSVFTQAKKYGLSYEQVDALTGTLLGRAKSGTYRTADVVGLDTLAHVIDTMQMQLPDDPFHASFTLSEELTALLQNKALGQKTGAGFYKKVGPDILRFDVATGAYVPTDASIDPEVAKVLAIKSPDERLQSLRDMQQPQARFVWAILRDMLHYSAVHLADIATTARDIDQAMRWGFGHQQGPFELWQAAGWTQVAEWIRSDIDEGLALSGEPLPTWVFDGPVHDAAAVHTEAGSWNPTTKKFEGRSGLAVYARQWLAPVVLGEVTTPARLAVYEDDAICAYTLDRELAEGVLIVEFKTKMHTLSPAVVEGVIAMVELAERDYLALVIAQPNDPFSAGADLKAILPLFEQGGAKAVEPVEQCMQDMVMRVRYAKVPVVTAVAGLALGGGCELLLHAAHRVAHIESYIGLVEAGIGLVPGAGGLTYGARRAAELQQLAAPQVPLLEFIKNYALNAATAKVSGSAVEAQTMGYLQPNDTIVMQRNELLFAAVNTARALALSGWRPPFAKQFPVAGRDGIATLRTQLENMRLGSFISDYDYHVALQICTVLCGGDVDPGTLVDENWLLHLEREAFLGLLAQEKTQERITSLLKTGKAVRN